MGTVASWPPELGFSGLLIAGTLPHGQSCRLGGHTGPTSLGPGPACVGEVAGSQIWVRGEASLPPSVLTPLKVGGGFVGNRCRTEPPPPSPPNALLVPVPVKCTWEDSLPQEMLL